MNTGSYHYIVGRDYYFILSYIVLCQILCRVILFDFQWNFLIIQYFYIQTFQMLFYLNSRPAKNTSHFIIRLWNLSLYCSWFDKKEDFLWNNTDLVWPFSVKHLCFLVTNRIIVLWNYVLEFLWKCIRFVESMLLKATWLFIYSYTSNKTAWLCLGNHCFINQEYMKGAYPTDMVVLYLSVTYLG